MTKIIYIVAIILVQSVLGAKAQNMGQCVDNLMSSVKAGGDLCPAGEEYIRCYFVALNVQTSRLSEANITNLQNTMEEYLSSHGLYCNIDIRAILKKVNEDESNAAMRTTNKPTAYDAAATIGDCLNTFTAANTQTSISNCSVLTPYLKCVIRVTGLYKFDPHSSTYSDGYSSLETQLETYSRSFGLFCNFDIEELSSEVASEQNYRNSESGLHTSVRGMMSLYTVAVAAWICSYFFQY
ncbi:hypothetical protein BsWGS_09439 [Bradybaena similaris]